MSVQEVTIDGPDLTDPTIFNEELAKANEQSEGDEFDIEDETPGVDDDLEEGGDEEDKSPEESDELDDDEQQSDDDEEDEPELSEKEKQSVKYFKKRLEDVEAKQNKYMQDAVAANMEAQKWQTAFNELADLIKQSQSAPEEEDTFEPLDEEGYGRLSKEIASLKSQLAERDSKSQHQEQISALANQLASQRATFMQTHPDYADAVAHLQQVKLNEFSYLHGDTPEARQKVDEYLTQTAAQSAMAGKNAAEVLYNLAKRTGYKGKKTGPDIKNISKNKARSSHTVDGQEVPISSDDPRAFLNDKTFEKLKGKNGRIDPAKFNQILEKANRRVG